MLARLQRLRGHLRGVEISLTRPEYVDPNRGTFGTLIPAIWGPRVPSVSVHVGMGRRGPRDAGQARLGIIGQPGGAKSGFELALAFQRRRRCDSGLAHYRTSSSALRNSGSKVELGSAALAFRTAASAAALWQPRLSSAESTS